jgi:hypothetical protein
VLVALALVCSRARATESDTPATSAHEAELSIAGRVVAEAMMGAGVGTLGYLAGPKLLGASCLSCRDAAGWAGVAVTFPLGVYWGGYVTGGRGRFLWTVPMSFVIAGASVLALTRGEDGSDNPPLDTVKWGVIASAPVTIALYELSHRWTVDHEREPAGLASVRWTVTPRPGGLTVGGDFRF